MQTTDVPETTRSRRRRSAFPAVDSSRSCSRPSETQCDRLRAKHQQVEIGAQQANNVVSCMLLLPGNIRSTCALNINKSNTYTIRTGTYRISSTLPARHGGRFVVAARLTNQDHTRQLVHQHVLRDRRVQRELAFKVSPNMIKQSVKMIEQKNNWLDRWT